MQSTLTTLGDAAAELYEIVVADPATVEIERVAARAGLELAAQVGLAAA